jgi:N-acyl-D-amino-acid deacylase
MLDLVIINGRLIDGSGAPWVRADIGISGDRIAACGNLKYVEAGKVVDARGMIVCPGIVDIHTHSDWAIAANPSADSTLRQGITTEVMGNCGMSVAPISSRNRDIVRGMLWSGPHFEPDWETFGDWLQRVEDAHPAINVACLVGHGTIRSAVIGDENRYTTPDELERMKALLREALEQGAAGLSSGLEYLPANQTTTEELVHLCQIVAEYGRLYATHMRDRGFRFLESVQECISIAEETGVAFQCSHMGAKPGPGDRAKIQLTAQSMLEDARNRGVDILADVNHVYQWGMGMLVCLLPPWVTAEGLGKAHEYLRDAEARRKIKADFDRYWLHPREGRWDDIVLKRASHSHRWEGMSIGEISQQVGKDGYDVIMDILDAEPDLKTLASALEYSMDVIQLQAESPLFAIGSDTTTLSAAEPFASYVTHPHHFGSVPHVLAFWVRERRWLTLAEAIRKMTSFPALRVGIRDRGLVRPGMFADILVFDEEKVRDTSTFDNPISYPEGIKHVIVNGQTAVRDGEPTEKRAGRVLRFS